ncbi:hypothetical protein BH09BAC5_BH09BAC5_22670 [soil metagenome]
MTDLSRKEAEIFGRYLLSGKLPNEKSISLYQESLRIRPANAIGKDEKILKFLLNHPAFIGIIDSALAFSKKKSIIRRKILFMSAILETQPEYAEMFLPQERKWHYNIYIFFVGTRAVFKMVAGKIVLAFF